MYLCFASTNRGLEELLAKEIGNFGGKDTNIVKSGVRFQADMTSIMKLNLHSRLASRIMLQVGFGNYSNEKDIYDIAYKVSWQEWFSVENSIKVATNAIASPLKSLEFITLKVKDAICDNFVAKYNSRPDVNKYTPDIRVYNFLTHDTVTIYLDTSGESLFKRGYRQNKLEAPLKENLAAGLINLTGWSKDIPFHDPMCGSGTIAIEAASYGLNIAPGLRRNFAFTHLLNYQKRLWQSLQEEAKEAINYKEELQIFASDIDQRAIDIAEDNCRKLGISKYIRFTCADFLSNKAPANSGILLTNPPYGVRLEEKEHLNAMYPKYASHLKKYYAAWNCYFLTSDLEMPKLMRLRPSKKIPLYNSELECRLFEFKMVSGSNRESK